MHALNRVILIIECFCVVIALVLGALWIKSPEASYEPITFFAILVGSTITELIRRYLPTSSVINSVPQDILIQIELSSSKEKVKEILGSPHRVISNMWLYRFREALVQVDFYENNAVKAVALALTINSPKRGFTVPMFDKPLGSISFGDFGRELAELRYRSTLRTSELLLETRVGPPGAWMNFTFGALAPLSPGMLADVNISTTTERVILSEAAKVRINWVGISESLEEQWFEWSLAIPAMA